MNYFFNKTNIVVLVFFLLSCNSKDNKENKNISENIIQLMTSMGKCYANIVIIPGSGCEGCISLTEDFLKENYERKEILYILIKTKSLKILNHKIGVDVRNISNIYIDDGTVLSNYKSEYPSVVKYNCNNKKVSNIIYQKPGKDAFKEL